MKTGGDHYYTREPATDDQRFPLKVEIAGRPVPLVSAAGVFSADRLDLGTSVLLGAVPDPPAAGDLLDLGCGWGPIALTLATLSPAATVWGVDVNRRAVSLLAENARSLSLYGVRPAAPSDVPADIGFSAIWSNPPIRIGKAALHELLHLWLPRLLPGCDAFLVVQRNLGADSLHTWLSGTFGREFDVARHASAKGFRVLRVSRPHDPELTSA